MKFRSLASALALTLVGLLGTSAQAAKIFAPGDPIVAIWNTTASGNSTDSTAGTGSAGQYPTNEAAPNVVDGTNNKYLNFGGGGGAGVQTDSKGVGTGFYITPGVTDSIVKAFQFTAANDAVNRDPLTITIEGSNAVGAALKTGTSWALIYSGTTGLATDPGRNTPGVLVPVTNSTTYDSYRVIVTSQRGIANSTQYAEVQFYTQVPEPTSLALAGIAGVGLLVVARRRRTA